MVRSKGAPSLTVPALRDGVDRAEPSSAAEEVAERISDLIITEDLPEGARLPSERDLAAMLGTSRPTVSQGIRILVVRGLVDSRRGSGAYVLRRPQDSLAASVDLMLSLDKASVDDLAELRLWLETMGTLRAIGHATEAEVQRAAESLDAIAASVGDVAAWMTADTTFHSTIVRASHNPFLASIYESVHTTLINYEYRTWIAGASVPEWLRPEAAAEQLELHRPILEALRARDPEAARDAVQRHHDAMRRHLALS